MTTSRVRSRLSRVEPDSLGAPRVQRGVALLAGSVPGLLLRSVSTLGLLAARLHAARAVAPPRLVGGQRPAADRAARKLRSPAHDSGRIAAKEEEPTAAARAPARVAVVDRRADWIAADHAAALREGGLHAKRQAVTPHSARILEPRWCRLGSALREGGKGGARRRGASAFLARVDV